MKKRTVSIILCMAMICLMLTGCMVEKNSITLNSDGSGSITTELYVKEEMREFFEGSQGVTQFDLEKTIDGEKYVGVQETQNFSNLDMLKQTLKYNDSSSLISGFTIDTAYEDGNQTATLKFSLIDKISFDKMFAFYSDTDGTQLGDPTTNNGESMSSSIKAYVDVTFPGNVISSSGNTKIMTITGNKAEFNLVPQETMEDFAVKAILRSGVTPGENNTDSKFPVTRTYENQFKDVKAEDWFYDSMVKTYNAGIVSGTSENTFNPYDEVSIAQAIVMAARVRSIYNGDNHSFAKTDAGDTWYQPYVDYAVDQGIIWSTDYEDGFDKAATRGDMAYIFANTLPSNEYAELNEITSLPDVLDFSDTYAYIIRLYKAGICQGNDKYGTFNANSTITRAETAVIISRVAFSSTRLHFTLEY